MARQRYFPASHPLPDWRNFGVVLRSLLGVNALGALFALAASPDLSGWAASFLSLAALLEPVLLVCLAFLAAGRDLLWRLPLRLAQGLVVLLAAAVMLLFLVYGESGGLITPLSRWRILLLAGAVTAILLGYFELRSRAFSPALAEARLTALTARIRPHFLFNTLNAVLSLIRTQPQQAETALESLSDLFRAAMHDPAQLISLRDEVDFGRQYLSLEQLRLGERLAVDWQIDPLLLDLPILPLILQPLLENAIHHGIEPAPAGGVVEIEISRQGEYLRIRVLNPLAEAAAPPGNQMALANIRERLALYYDLEARLETRVSDKRYEVCILWPCPRKKLR